MDASGNVYTTGYLNDKGVFDPGPGTFSLTSAGGGDISISKLPETFPWTMFLPAVLNNTQP